MRVIAEILGRTEGRTSTTKLKKAVAGLVDEAVIWHKLNSKTSPLDVLEIEEGNSIYRRYSLNFNGDAEHGRTYGHYSMNRTTGDITSFGIVCGYVQTREAVERSRDLLKFSGVKIRS